MKPNGVHEAAAPQIDDTDERYTLTTELAECLKYTGVKRYTLDVAACAAAHVADRWLSKHENAFRVDWGRGHDVWCNPPYSGINLQLWVELLWKESERQHTITMLAPCSTEQAWWQEFIEPFRDGRARRNGLQQPHGSTCHLSSHFLAGRRRFGNPQDPRGLLVKGSPYFWLVALVWRH